MEAESRTYPNWTDVTEAEVFDPDWASVAVVGEYTTGGGPWTDDYFLAVVQRDGQIYSYPTYLTNDVVPKLEKTLGIPIRFGMANRTDSASRIIFPPTLAEKPLFDWVSNYPRDSFVGRAIDVLTLGGAAETTGKLTYDVAHYLDSLTPGAASSLAEAADARRTSRRTFDLPASLIVYLVGAILALGYALTHFAGLMITLGDALIRRFALS